MPTELRAKEVPAGLTGEERKQARRDRERAEKVVVRFYDEASEPFAMTVETAQEVS